jgi:hypothetical protein
MLIQSFAFDVSKLMSSINAPVYREHWIPKHATNANRPIKVKSKLDINWTKKQCLNRAYTLAHEALQHAGVLGHPDSKKALNAAGNDLNSYLDIIRLAVSLFPENEKCEFFQYVTSKNYLNAKSVSYF